jgi:D-alanyl-D-alanine carboxypeptidase/D-alanyl-D-alanine-endopeptidase (penicillin-binding protein 4)
MLVALAGGARAAAAEERQPGKARPSSVSTPAGAATPAAEPRPAGPSLPPLPDAPPALPGPLPPFPPAPADLTLRKDWLKVRLNELFAPGRLAPAKVSILVTEFDNGKVLYARGEKVALNAASNVKLLTAAAALAQLGPEYRWKTSVLGPAKVSGRTLEPGGELPGDLTLRGSGDPTLTAEHLASLAADLASAGLRRVRGGLVVDATLFDANNIGPAYDQKQESAAFRSPSSAASLNANAVAVIITPGAVAGAPARVVIDPPSPYFVVTGRVTTARHAPAVPIVETSDTGSGQTRITLSGRVHLGTEPRAYLRRVIHPDLFLGNTFRQILLKRGITLEKPLRLGAPPSDGARVLASHESAPLAVVVQDLNKRSSNFAAEQVVRTLGAEILGRPGTWEKGLETVARYLEGIGIPRASYRMANGAGLYDSNRFSAEQITHVIRSAMRDFRISGEFLASLSVAGADGTLAHRMGSTVAERYVRAKTGSLANASCLSGVVGAQGQRPLIFSILLNDLNQTQAAEARMAQDRAAEILVSYLEPAPP